MYITFDVSIDFVFFIPFLILLLVLFVSFSATVLLVRPGNVALPSDCTFPIAHDFYQVQQWIQQYTHTMTNQQQHDNDTNKQTKQTTDTSSGQFNTF